MILVDANLLLYAYDSKSGQHQASKAWLEETLSGSELVRFAWVTLWGFLRISTNPRIFERPLTISDAESAVSQWLAQPTAGILEPGEQYWEVLRRLLRNSQVRGPLVMDAAIAALAIEHGARLHSADRDFTRFAGLRWTNPLAGPE